MGDILFIRLESPEVFLEIIYNAMTTFFIKNASYISITFSSVLDFANYNILCKKKRTPAVIF